MTWYTTIPSSTGVFLISVAFAEKALVFGVFYGSQFSRHMRLTAISCYKLTKEK